MVSLMMVERMAARRISNTGKWPASVSPPATVVTVNVLDVYIGHANISCA